ncbi:hypothetical protein B0A48_04424 [Cryoendolithus antarcticus]|uniref:Major facilitator superfamily (MFS) profile domain-containing protein n=1 Tax=Cryoendolithus antarcticus TaxID=1507870 RepID=A0A1V8TFN4_9PEZI|nr:hypothetical protein B0A48_04424 [Cryoendolithus antarcticus]
MDEKHIAMVERHELAEDEINGLKQTATMGTVTINDTEELMLVPQPSADPRDPLNMPKWRKILFVVLLSIFSSAGLSMVSGFGGLLGFYIPGYVEKGATYADITALMTYPSMFMGVGNLISMPLALAIGRRPVYLGSCMILILGGCLCAYAKDYNHHLWLRMLIGIGAGNSEALVPMMIQEVHFIHERSQCLMWQVAMQTIVSAILNIFASPIAGAVGTTAWYLIGVGLSAAVLIVSIFFVPEKKYVRDLSAYGQSAELIAGHIDEKFEPKPMRMSERPALDTVRYQPRTLRSDMRLFVNKPDWSEGFYALKNTFQIMLFPNVFWIFCLNGFTLGVNIALATTYGTILSAPPYNFSNDKVSYINVAQIFTALVALPLLGKGSDWIIKRQARKNDGVHEPEARLLPLGIPLAFGVIAAVLYGQAAQFPGKLHWFAIVFAYGAYYLCFIGSNIVGITFLLDSYPARAGPALVVICSMRGFVSFGSSYGVAKFIETAGYDGAFGAYAGITAGLGLIGIPIYFFGKRIRQFTGKWAVKERTGKPSLTH